MAGVETLGHPAHALALLHPRLASGNLLLVKHGPLDTRTSRSHLTAYLSKDDGKTWGGGLLLDERAGVSYPDGQQTPDGLIRIIYDYNRTADRNILMAAFREEDVSAGKPVSRDVRLRQLVSKATGGQEKPKTSTAPVHANADGKPLRTAKPGTLTSADAKSQPLVPGAKLFTDRAYVAAELPAALKNAHFLAHRDERPEDAQVRAPWHRLLPHARARHATATPPRNR